MAGGIGIFGGTFNPIHLGHLRAALEVYEAEGLAEMRFVPAALPPHKQATDLVTATHRLRMLDLAIAGVPAFRTWTVELERPGPSFTIDTLRALRAEVGPTERIALVLGRDAFRDFGTWKEPAAILGLCDVVVMSRPPWPDALELAEFPVATRGAVCYDSVSESFRHESGHVVKLQRLTALDISATAIRTLCAAGRSIRFLVPPAVEEYIRAERLYRGEDRLR